MKKILTLLVFSITAISASAQMTIIPKAGLSLSKIASEEDDEMKSKIGLILGLGLNFQVNDMFSVQPELQFVQKGFRIDYSYSFGGYTEEVKSDIAINYLEIPILVKTTFGSDNFKFFLNAGPSIGFGLGGKAKTEFSFSDGVDDFSGSSNGKVKFGDEPDSNEEDIYFDNRMDFGVQLGGGFLIAKKVMVDIRYGLGLSNLMKKEDGMTAEEAKSKNRVIQFTVGVPFPMN
jgi:hypothetical protein